MANMNRVFLMGNLTRDPELRHLPSGSAVADLGLAVSENYKNKDGELVESACFVDVVVWGETAENCKKFLSKGSPVMIDGKLKLDKWETDDGEKRSKMRVQAFRVQFLGRPHSKSDTGELQESSEEKPEKPEKVAVADDMPF